MAIRIYISATDQNAGKTTLSIALLHLARQQGRRIAFLKPIGPKPVSFEGRLIDTDAVTVAQVFGLEEQLDAMCPVVVAPGVSQRALRGELPVAQLEEQILTAVARLEQTCDLLVIEGAGHSGVGSVLGLSNARVAALVGAPVLMVTGGGVGSVIDAVCMNLALYRECGATVRLLVPNKLDRHKRDSTLEYLRLAFHASPFAVHGGFNVQPVLANPTFKRIARLLDGTICGRPSDPLRIIHHVALGAGSTQRVVDMLQHNTLVLATSSRDELLVTLANLYNLPEYRRRIVGLVITGSLPVSTITQQIVEDSGIPYLRIHQTMSKVFLAIHEDVSKLSGEEDEKIALIRHLAPKRFDLDEIEALFR